MNKQEQHIVFLGIGGIGMSSIARHYLSIGTPVFGYDKVRTALTDELIQEGAQITFNEDLGVYPGWDVEETTVIYTPAMPEGLKWLEFFSRFKMIKRAQALGLLANPKRCLAVAGTHGKTSTSAMLLHILSEAGEDPTGFIGGIMTSTGTNYRLGNGPWVVVEADEFDRSFMHLQPEAAAVTTIDADHLDIYNDVDDMKNTFKMFASNTKQNGMLLVNKSIDVDFEAPLDGSLMTYSSAVRADNIAFNLRIEDGSQYFDANFKEIMPGQVYEYELKDIQLQLPGKHNVENAIAAIVVASSLGAKPEKIKAAIKDFKGVKRRYDLHAKGKYVYIDDYAHHPEEIKATLVATKELFPEKKITVVFQPHLYSRTRDFAAEFGDSLSLADEVLLLDIYPAREMPIEGVNSEMLLTQVVDCEKSLLKKSDLVEELTNPKRELLLTLGAGDIDQFVEPLKHYYVNEMD